MTLSESAINEILAVLNEGGGADLVRQLAQFGIQELIEVEATEAIGAAAWERSPERVTHRNGHRPRTLSTKAGDLELGIPKFRRGAFFPEILEPRRRIDQAMYAVVMEAYVNGVSTRSVASAAGRVRPRPPTSQAPIRVTAGHAHHPWAERSSERLHPARGFPRCPRPACPTFVAAP